MKEVNFKDRVPTYPGRVILTPVVGASNTYDLIRADEPTEDGTPLDKATFNSIIHSRLTGRYYMPTVTETEVSNATLLNNPIPTTGWMETTKTFASNSGYELYSSGASVQSDNIDAAFDGDASTYWRGLSGNTDNYICFKLPKEIFVSKVKLSVIYTNEDWYGVTIQGSNNGTNWVNISGQVTTGRNTEPVEIVLDSSNAYSYYRALFVDVPESIGIDVYSFGLSESTTKTAGIEYTVAEGTPLNFDVGQRITIETPSNYSTVGIVSNTFNGNKLNAILQPARKYELVWNGSVFVVREA